MPPKAIDLLKKYARKGDIFIAQLETNLEALYKGIDFAHELGMYIIINPSPVCEFNKSILSKVDLLILNAAEAKLLTGVNYKNNNDLQEIHDKLKAKSTIVTLGEDGAYLIRDNEIIYQLAIPTNVVDTTCAGDTFRCISVSESKWLRNRRFITLCRDRFKYCSIKKRGNPTAPYLNEILELYK